MEKKQCAEVDTKPSVMEAMPPLEEQLPLEDQPSIERPVPASINDFVLPIASPTKKRLAADGSCAPESPDMKFARHRLGSLLHSIRKGDIPANLPKGKQGEEQEADEQQRRGPGRPRKTKAKERRVVFELRGKPFGLRDQSHAEPVFVLCRTWMRGKEEPPAQDPPALYPPPSDDSLDLLATKEILSLPRARSPPPEGNAWPGRAARLDVHVPTSGGRKEDIMASYAHHWRNVKKEWKEHAALRERRFHRSVNLIETVYGIAQQNAL